MSLKERERDILNQIKSWEHSLADYQPNDLESAYETYLEQSFSLLPEDTQKQFFSLFDSGMFYLHSFIHGSHLQVDAKERILEAGRVFRQEIASVEDMRELSIEQCEFIAGQQIARHRIYSFIQGGASASSGAALLSDLPAMAVINLRAVQLIGTSYGYEANTPFEMMASLKVFHAAMMPRRLQGKAWAELMEDLENAEDYYFYSGREELADVTWLEQPVGQMMKGLAILMFRKKLLKGLPVISMAIGAGANYQLTRKLTEFAHRYYQMRHLIHKGVRAE